MKQYALVPKVHNVHNATEVNKLCVIRMCYNTLVIHGHQKLVFFEPGIQAPIYQKFAE